MKAVQDREAFVALLCKLFHLVTLQHLASSFDLIPSHHKCRTKAAIAGLIVDQVDFPPLSLVSKLVDYSKIIRKEVSWRDLRSCTHCHTAIRLVQHGYGTPVGGTASSSRQP